MKRFLLQRDKTLERRSRDVDRRAQPPCRGKKTLDEKGLNRSLKGNEACARPVPHCIARDSVAGLVVAFAHAMARPRLISTPFGEFLPRPAHSAGLFVFAYVSKENL
jgi:hypothetical protein